MATPEISSRMEFLNHLDPHGPRKLRGRKAADNLFQIVGSKYKRDIVRRNNFMPGQFQLWNKNPKGGNNKYYGSMEDYDNDKIPHEFVVRRGDRNGPVVAVNGYTTKKSDWGARKVFYEANPTKEQRKHKTPKQFMKDYYGATYEPDRMTVDTYKVDPETDKFTKDWENYNLYIPKDISPYKAFSTNITYPAIKKVFLDLAGGDKEKAKAYRKQIMASQGVGYMSTIASDCFFDIVKRPVLIYLNDNGYIDELATAYTVMKREKGQPVPANFSDDKEFEQFIFSRAGVKKVVKRMTAPILTDDATFKETYDVVYKEIMQDIKRLLGM